MKRIILTIISVLAFSGAYAEGFNNGGNNAIWQPNKDSSGNWIGDGKHDKILRVDRGTTKIIKLEGDVTITDRIFVGSSTTNTENPAPAVLEIYNATNHDVRIKGYVWNNNSGSNVLFSVWENATLKIHGKPGARIIIDGNGGITHPITNATGATVTHHECDNSGAWDGTRWGLIESTGTLDFEYVTIENVSFTRHDYSLGSTKYSNKSDGDCAVIKLNPWTYTKDNGTTYCYTQKTTTFKNCIFHGIRNEDADENYAGYASVLTTYGNAGQRSENNRTSCKITFDDCEIYDVKQNGHTKTMRYGTEKVDNDAGSAGLIRFRGSWPGDMDLINTKIHHNYSKYDCAGVLWNAIGSGDPAKMPLLTINGCQFYNNTTEGDAGALRLEGNFTFSGKKSEFYNNKAKRGGAIQVWGYSGGDEVKQGTLTQTFNELVDCHDNSADQGGALFIAYEGGLCHLPSGMTVNTYFNGCTFKNNTANWQGGAICLNNSSLNTWKLKLYLDKATFTGNKVTNTSNGCGGALHTWNFDVEARAGAEGCVFEDNKANNSGAGMYVEGTSTVTLDNLTFKRNKVCEDGSSAGYGGAIAGNGGNVTLNLKKVTVDDCFANTSGGGVFLKNGAKCTIDNATITNCKTNGSGGGVHVSGSSLTMNSGQINGNTASSHGGGIYFDNDVTDASAKTFKFGGGSISNNTSGGFGGGVCIYTGGTSGSTFEITGGNISNNTAENGGGLYLNGWGVYKNDARIPLTNTNIENNTAYMGGGVLVYNGGINYKNGLIRYNKAIARAGNSEPGTMYQQNHCDNTNGDKVDTSKSGIGGGIYSTWSQINFETSDKFGIYSNTADFGADDLFANAHNSTMDLPNPIGMTVTGFNVPSTSLHWYEDYIKGDTGFSHKPSTAGSGPASGAERYRTLLYDLSNDLAKSKFEPLDDSGDYIMAALGYNFVYAKIAKTGLKKGETAIMNIYEGEISSMSGATPYAQVALTGDSSGNAQRQILLHPGKWTVVESKWSWSYTGSASGDGTKTVDSLPAITRSLDENSTENVRTFSFSNTKTDTEHNAEECVKNQINL